MKTEWNMRREKNAPKVEILIYEDIGDGMFGGLSAKSFIDQLTALGELEELDVRINSWGGIGAEGIAMLNALERHPATVTVHVDAMAASAASIVAMAASPGRLFIAPNARLMIHPAWTGMVGNRHEFAHEATVLEQLDHQIAAIYAKRTGRRAATMLALMDANNGAGTYYTGQEAVDEGFADKVANEPSAMNAPRRGPAMNCLKLPPGLDLASQPTDAGGEADAAAQLATAVELRMRMLEIEGAA